jgi:hypothetical protein
MPRVRTTVAALVAVLALNAIAVTAASANWFVGEAELPSGSKAALATKATVETSFVLSIPAATTKVTCTALSPQKTEIVETNSIAGAELVFSSCAVSEGATKCALEKSEIRTNSEGLTGTVSEGTEPEDRITFAQTKSKALASIPFNSSCALSGSQSMSGSLKLAAPALQEELTEQAVQGESTKATGLTVGGDAAFLSGKAKVKLASGKKFQNVAPQHWYSGLVKVAESNEAGGLAVGTGSGAANVTFQVVGGLNRTCKLTDSGKVWNPNGGGSGQTSITAATFTGCTSTTCLTVPELQAPMAGLPWRGFLLPPQARGGPVRLVIGAMRLESSCAGVEATTFNGAAAVSVFNGSGVGEAACTEAEHTTWFEFTATNNLLSNATENGSLSGKDCIWGQAANEVIKVKP